jgi:3-phenylpropionate/cinnamic acid dioxygenase small subunit
LGIKGDLPEVREMRIKHHNQIWGYSGSNLPEDITATESQWEMMRTGAVRYSVIAREGPVYSDETLRIWYTEWSRRMGRSYWAPFTEQEPIYHKAVTVNSCSLLDDGRLLEWTELFIDDGWYELLFKNKEIGEKEDFLLKLQKADLVETIKVLPHHIVDTAKRLHMLSNIKIRFNGDAGHSRCNFAVYRTIESGKSGLYAVGRNEDDVIKKGNRWLFQRHRVVLDTRMLETHTHIPI